MKKFIMSFAVAVLSFVLFYGTSQAEVSFGLSADQDGLRSFYLSVGDQYKVSEKQIVYVREKKIPDDEMPVVFFLARHASVDPKLIIELRLGGSSWIEISNHYNLSPSIYYVAFQKDPGPPYGKAWGYYKNKKKDQWKNITLSDADIVNFVNIKFASEHFGYSPDEIIKMRDKNQDFVSFNMKVKKLKQGKQAQSKQLAESENPSKGKSDKGKSKGKKK